MAVLNLDRIYRHRFDGIPPATKLGVWREISSHILNDAKQLRGGEPALSILDPACGDGEFLNGCSNLGRGLVGCDLRDRPLSLHDGIAFHKGYFQTMALDQHFDLIWVSNLLEHLPSPEIVQEFLANCAQRLNPNGVLTIMGPNIKYCADEYWDFADHLLPLSHYTVLEHLASAGFQTLVCTPRFLPYSFRSRLPAHPLLTKIYLNSPPAWNLLGKQFLIRARAATG
jgi:2-polyprenyl-3-methyl-5-hydroxy-6-metoxy-1,4-benzoquinol methylase